VLTVDMNRLKPAGVILMAYGLPLPPAIGPSLMA